MPTARPTREGKQSAVSAAAGARMKKSSSRHHPAHVSFSPCVKPVNERSIKLTNVCKDFH